MHHALLRCIFEARQVGVMLVATGAEEKKQPKHIGGVAAYARYWRNDVTMPTHLGSNYWHVCRSKLARGFPALEPRAPGRTRYMYLYIHVLSTLQIYNTRPKPDARLALDKADFIISVVAKSLYDW